MECYEKKRTKWKVTKGDNGDDFFLERTRYAMQSNARYGELNLGVEENTGKIFVGMNMGVLGKVATLYNVQSYR